MGLLHGQDGPFKICPLVFLSSSHNGGRHPSECRRAYLVCEGSSRREKRGNVVPNRYWCLFFLLSVHEKEMNKICPRDTQLRTQSASDPAREGRWGGWEGERDLNSCMYRYGQEIPINGDVGIPFLTYPARSRPLGEDTCSGPDSSASSDPP